MEKEPIMSKCVSAGTRVYYIDVFKDKKEMPYLFITEIPTGKSPGNKKRHRILIHSNNIGKFTEALNEIVSQLSNVSP